MINVELFKTEWNKIREKMELINRIPKLYGTGNDFAGMEIEEEEILYKTETFYPGCGSDYFSFYVSWDEINNPIEYFEEKYKKEIEANEIKKAKIAEKEKLLREERERQEYELLKKKYENT
jgi:predicted ribosome quality control (RQC) complex YloA/Tae2 family protein